MFLIVYHIKDVSNHFAKKKKKEAKIKFKRKYKMEKNVEKKIINEDNNKNDNGIKTKERRFTSFNKK